MDNIYNSESITSGGGYSTNRSNSQAEGTSPQPFKTRSILDENHAESEQRECLADKLEVIENEILRIKKRLDALGERLREMHKSAPVLSERLRIEDQEPTAIPPPPTKGYHSINEKDYPKS